METRSQPDRSAEDQARIVNGPCAAEAADGDRRHFSERGSARVHAFFFAPPKSWNRKSA